MLLTSFSRTAWGRCSPTALMSVLMLMYTPSAVLLISGRFRTINISSPLYFPFNH